MEIDVVVEIQVEVFVPIDTQAETGRPHWTGQCRCRGTRRRWTALAGRRWTALAGRRWRQYYRWRRTCYWRSFRIILVSPLVQVNVSSSYFYDHYYAIVPTHWLPGDFFMVVIHHWLIDILKCIWLVSTIAMGLPQLTLTTCMQDYIVNVSIADIWILNTVAFDICIYCMAGQGNGRIGLIYFFMKVFSCTSIPASDSNPLS